MAVEHVIAVSEAGGEWRARFLSTHVLNGMEGVARSPLVAVRLLLDALEESDRNRFRGEEEVP